MRAKLVLACSRKFADVATDIGCLPIEKIEGIDSIEGNEGQLGGCVIQRSLLTLAIVIGLITIAATFGCASFRAARLYQSGTEAMNGGRTDQAVADLSAAAKLAPGASEIHNHLGLALAAVGQDGRALAEFQRAVQLDCTNAAAVDNLDLARTNEERRRAVATLSNSRDVGDE
jgi:tetratricopeptide (TPR) repeat protein